jgi:hypothetical protein
MIGEAGEKLPKDPDSSPLSHPGIVRAIPAKSAAETAPESLLSLTRVSGGRFRYLTYERLRQR